MSQQQSILSNTQLLRMTAAFSRFIWGLPVMLLLFAETMRIPVAPIPSYVVGVILVFWGVALLLGVRPVNPRMDRKIELAVLLSLLQLYFVPFLYWWSQHPESYFYSVNILLMALSTAALLILLNQLAAEFAELCSDKFFKVEAMLCAWIAMGLLITLLLALMIYLGVHFFQTGARYLPRMQLYPWMLAILVMPFTLTLASMWKCRKKCLELLD